jgi:hypothetical protein
MAVPPGRGRDHTFKKHAAIQGLDQTLDRLEAHLAKMAWRRLANDSKRRRNMEGKRNSPVGEPRKRALIMMKVFAVLLRLDTPLLDRWPEKDHASPIR